MEDANRKKEVIMAQDYHVFEIPKKSGGVRVIAAPCDELKEKQRQLLQTLYEKGTHLKKVSSYAFGFIPGRNNVSNAMVHAGKRYVLNVDIKDFFPACKENHRIIQKLGLTEYWSNMIFYKGSLPQGAPTSPLISNLFLSPVDMALPLILKLRISDDIHYSRYVDDITVSSNSKAIFSDVCLGIIKSILKKHGFEINNEKIKKMSRSRRQEVTGLVVNSGQVTVSKQLRRKIRAAVHNIVTGKTRPTAHELTQLRGKLAYIMQVPAHREWAIEQLEKIGVNVDRSQEPTYFTPPTQTPEETMDRLLAYCNNNNMQISYNKVIIRSRLSSMDEKIACIDNIISHQVIDRVWSLMSNKKDLALAYLDHVVNNFRDSTRKQRNLAKRIFDNLSESKKVEYMLIYGCIDKFRT